MKRILTCFSIFALIFLFSCQEDKPTIFAADRPYQPWVFRSVLDLQPRMLTLALDENLWAAYHADNGALYKVWKGNVELTGAVYDNHHGPQPVSLGDAYFINNIKNQWTLTKENKVSSLKSKYQGHRMVSGQVELMYELEMENEESILVYEKPEYIESVDGLIGFERVFSFKNIPSGGKLNFKTNVSSVSPVNVKNKFQSDGNLKITKTKNQTRGDISAVELEAELEMNTEGSTRLVAFFVKKPMIKNPNKKSGEEAEVLALPLGQRLINKSDCKTCHNQTQKTIGPSYVEISKRYTRTEDNISTLTQKLINGGAGNWGEVVMSPHPNLSEIDAKEMIQFILSLNTDEVSESESKVEISPEDFFEAATVEEGNLIKGLMLQVQEYDYDILKLADLKLNKKPSFAGAVPKISFLDTDFSGLESNFALIGDGYVSIPEDGVYTFRLISDDGSQLLIDGKQIIDNDGLHGADIKDGTIGLKKGFHKLHLEFFQGYGGKSVLLKWKPLKGKRFEFIDEKSMSHPKELAAKFERYDMPFLNDLRTPGDGFALKGVHPSYDLSQARPDGFLPKVGGMDFLDDGRLVISTWNEEGGVYIIENAKAGDPSKMKTKKIAQGLAEPLGLKVVDGDIYILQKQELTRLVDTDGDDVIDEYQMVANSWKVSNNFHEFAFGLAFKDDHFYATLATGIMPGGASMNPQVSDRGKVVKISKKDGSVEFVAHGLRTPNGIGLGVDNEIFVADNQGDWLPSSKIVHVKKDAWYGSRSVDFEGTANLKENLPVVWLPQNEIGNSPSTPLALNDGIYKGQMIHGEVTHGGVKRVFVEKINGEYQGCVFRFIQGLEGGVNRMVWGPDGALYVGCIGNPGNWGQTGKLWYGLQRLKYNNTSTFEMLAVRAKPNGVEIEFTEPLAEGIGMDAKNYEIQQWRYEPTAEYGGPKLDEKNLNVSSIDISDDRKKVFLKLDGMQSNRVVYVHLKGKITSEKNNKLWTTEGWYTMNSIPN